jgi:hypothetical protein
MPWVSPLFPFSGGCAPSGVSVRLRYDHHIFVTVACVALTLAIPQGAFAWDREGHQIIVIVAEHYMRPGTAACVRELLAPESPEEASVWADEYRHDHLGP